MKVIKIWLTKFYVLRLSGADRLPFDDGKLDLVTICQAIHWLNVEDFYAEVENRNLDNTVSFMDTLFFVLRLTEL